MQTNSSPKSLTSHDIASYTTDILGMFSEVSKQAKYPKIVQLALDRINNMFELQDSYQAPISHIYKHNSLSRPHHVSRFLLADCQSLVWIIGSIVFATFQLVHLFQGYHSQVNLEKLSTAINDKKLCWDEISECYLDTSEIKPMMQEAFILANRLTVIRQPKMELGLYSKIFMVVSAVIGTVGVFKHSRTLTAIGFGSCSISAFFSLIIYGKSGSLAFEESQLSRRLERLVIEMHRILEEGITKHICIKN